MGAATEPKEALVSVIVPVHDGIPLLDETAASVEAQTHRRVERIAVDDGSRDGSGDRLRARGGWQVIASSGLGTNRARQRGIAAATGDFVALLDQDDLWHPEHIARCLDVLALHPDAPAAVGRRRTFRHRSDLVLSTSSGPPVRRDPWRWYPFGVIDTPSMVVFRRGPLDAIGGWPADRPLGADPIAWWRLGLLGALVVTASRTVGVRLSRESRSSTQRRDPLSYLSQLRSGAVEVAGALPPGRREAAASFGAGVMDGVAGVLESLLSHGEVAPAARALEQRLEGCPDGLVLVAVRFLGWLSGGDGPAVRRLGEAALLEWPHDAPRTRREMRRLAAMFGATAAVVGSRPAALARPDTWRCAAEGALFRLAAAVGRVGDPLDLDLGPSPWATGGTA